MPEGVFLFVVNRKEGALQQRDRDILLDRGRDDIITSLQLKNPIGYRRRWHHSFVFDKEIPLRLGDWEMKENCWCTHLKLSVSSLFCSHLHTCRFLQRSNSSDVFTLKYTNTQQIWEKQQRSQLQVAFHIKRHLRSGKERVFLHRYCVSLNRCSFYRLCPLRRDFHQEIWLPPVRSLYVHTSERETYMVSTFTSVISCRSSLQEVELYSKVPSERSRYLPGSTESDTRPLNTCTHTAGTTWDGLPPGRI